jgi:hypothetical protein
VPLSNEDGWRSAMVLDHFPAQVGVMNGSPGFGRDAVAC